VARAEHPADAPAAADDDAAHPGTATAAAGPCRAPAALMSCSPSGVVLTAGTELARLTGRPLGALSGVPAHELLDPSSSDLLRYVLRAARGGAGSGAATFRLRHADGSSVDLPTCWSVLAGTSPDATQLVFVRADGRVADLTYGPRARARLRAAAPPDGAGPPPDRGPVHVVERTLDRDLGHRYELATDLRTALADEAVHLEYQPIVDLRSGVVVGLEALARWTHPEHGPVSPSSFVTVAELSGLAPQLDRRVLRQALHDAARLRRERVVPEDAYVAVNLSAASLTDATLLDDLVRWTEATGLPPSRLVLEITETAIMQNTDVAVSLLRDLRERGVRVAMDDFGTGYSSLAYLRDLPISALKIDRSFIADIAEQRDALAIVGWIVDLARAVGVAVVAEGVETPEQVALLQGLGCVTAQGWLWGPAVSVGALLGRGTWTRPLPPTAAPVAATRTTGRDAGVASSVQRLLELHRNGASAATIAATLNAERLRTPTGVRWHGAGVARVLAHQIRRCGGAPDPAPGPRHLAWRRKSAGPPPP
jgi:EAL domain-containing protein (putative c-di-GMP-specific phosphodiesterase class I)